MTTTTKRQKRITLQPEEVGPYIEKLEARQSSLRDQLGEALADGNEESAAALRAEQEYVRSALEETSFMMAALRRRDKAKQDKEDHQKNATCFAAYLEADKERVAAGRKFDALLDEIEAAYIDVDLKWRAAMTAAQRAGRTPPRYPTAHSFRSAMKRACPKFATAIGARAPGLARPFAGD